jgi:hypothetical protein
MLFHGLRKTLRSQLVSRKTKLLKYKTLVRPVIMYASETWTLKTTEERSLCSFERRILRCILGAVLENGEWRRRYNEGLYQLFEKPDIVTCIKINRLRWCGHVVRMDPQRTVQKVFNSKPCRSSKIGRPKLRWEDGVLQDIRPLDIRNWRDMVMRREEWQRLLWKAKAHPGLSSQ